MDRLTALPNLLHIAAQMQHRSPLHPRTHAYHPLLALSLVSKHFHALVESHCLRALSRTLAQRTPSIDCRGAYIWHAQSHCRICQSGASVSDSVTGECYGAAICFECDWDNWKARIARDGEALICVMNGAARLVSRVDQVLAAK